MAHDFGVKYMGHGWNIALGVAADLQLASAFPDTDLVEFIGGSPYYVDGILRQPFTLDHEGYLNIPDLPGLGVGVELDPDKVDVMTYRGSVALAASGSNAPHTRKSSPNPVLIGIDWGSSNMRVALIDAAARPVYSQ